jgi:hypothetical protein
MKVSGDDASLRGEYSAERAMAGVIATAGSGEGGKASAILSALHGNYSTYGEDHVG